MTAQRRQPKAVYPGKVAIRHAVEAARIVGLDVGGIELAPDGTIRVLDKRSLPSQAVDELDRWLAEGRL